MIAWTLSSNDDIEEIDVDFEVLVSKSDNLDFVDGGEYMDFERYLAKAVEKHGALVSVWVDGRRYMRRAVISDAVRTSTRRRFDPSLVGVFASGHVRGWDKVLYMKYDSIYEMTDRDIYIDYRGKRYVAVADSVVRLGEKPVYYWMVVRDVAAVSGDYFDDLGG